MWGGEDIEPSLYKPIKEEGSPQSASKETGKKVSRPHNQLPSIFWIQSVFFLRCQAAFLRAYLSENHTLKSNVYITLYTKMISHTLYLFKSPPNGCIFGEEGAQKFPSITLPL